MFKTRNIIPTNVWALSDDGGAEGTLHLRLFLIFLFFSVFTGRFLGLSSAAASWSIRHIENSLLNIFGTLQVLPHLLLVKLDQGWILFD